MAQAGNAPSINVSGEPTINSSNVGPRVLNPTFSEMNRNDSCSEFGKMETVNLLQTDGNITQDSTDNKTKIPETKGESEAAKDLNLSQYFKPDVIPSSMQDFFSTVATVPPTIETKEKAATEPCAQSQETAVKQPNLSKFFAEDKSGHDTSGKTFFDLIASKDTAVNPKTRDVGAGDVVTKTAKDLPFLSKNDSEDDMYEAWLPSETTRKILVSLVTSVPGTFFPNKEHLTRPSVIIEEEMEDPLKLLLFEVNSPLAAQRKVLTANNVEQNEEGLRKLMEADCYHAAINLTTRLLKNGYGSLEHNPLTPKVLQIWFTRLALFVKLGKFPLAEVEAEAFGNLDKPDLYYEFFPDIYPNKKGSMVPFSFRILLAELPQYQGNHQTALNALYSLLHIIQKIIINLEKGCTEDGAMIELPEARRNASLDVWKSREIKVLYSVLNCVLSQKDFVMAISVASLLMQKDKDAIQLYSAVGRIYLQLGDMKQAQQFFDVVAIAAEKSEETSLKLECLINNGLLAVAYNNNEEAYKFYEKGLALKPNDPMLVNNAAVCLLYMGRLKESLMLLEQTIQANPSACLHEGILFNICTLYELESSHCTLKKQAMLDLVSKYVGDNFNVSCLKIPPPGKS